MSCLTSQEQRKTNNLNYSHPSCMFVVVCDFCVSVLCLSDYKLVFVDDGDLRKGNKAVWDKFTLYKKSGKHKSVVERSLNYGRNH